MTEIPDWLLGLARKIEDIERRMCKVEEIAFEVQAEKTMAKVGEWAKENLSLPEEEKTRDRPEAR